MGKQISKKFFTFFLTLLLIVSSFPQLSAASDQTKKEMSFEDVVSKGIYDPNEDYKYLDVRFWEDEKPNIGFYVNQSALYNYLSVENPGYGTNSGEWTVLGILRGMGVGYDYIDRIDKSYFDEYINRVENHVLAVDGHLDNFKVTEWSRVILALSALGYNAKDVAGYDFIKKLSDSFEDVSWQGMNGPIFALIALNTGNYELYEDGDNTIGKMLDYIVDNEDENGGWALNPFFDADADMTGMALQALAPYYLNKSLVENSDAKTSYDELAKSVERGVLALSKMQLDNGGFPAFNNVNVESTVQVVVALTALNIDPLASSISLPKIGENVSFITDGVLHDGVKTNNMIDKLLTFWAPGSFDAKNKDDITRLAGGFRHITSGEDGGGSAGTGVNGMATDQALYGIVAYDRFLKGKNSLYDMSDMINGEYKDLAPIKQKVTLQFEDDIIVENENRYSIYTLPKASEIKGQTFDSWNSKEDGSGITYHAEELLVVPEQDITLYAQYEYETYTIDYELNDGSFISDDIIKEYTNEEDVVLPTEDDVVREGYKFVGWFDNANFSGDKVEKVNKDSTGDKTFYAKWEEAVNEDEVAGKEVNNLIDSLPSIENITLAHKAEVENTRTAYEALSSDAKKYVTKLFKLEGLEQKIKHLETEEEFTEKKAALETEIAKALETDIPNITNESAEQLGSSVGKAENVLRQSKKAVNTSVLFVANNTTMPTDNDALLQKLTDSLAELQSAIKDIQYKSEEDVEEVVLSHLYFEVSRLSAYDLEEVSTEKKEEIEQTISNAKQLLEDESVTQEEIDEIVLGLKNVIEHFDDEEQSVDKSNLEKAIESAENENTTNKTTESIQKLQDAIANGKEILNNPDATQEEVNQAIDAINLAISQLEDQPNKGTLEEVYEKAQKIDLSNKTEESKEKLQKAINNAKSVLEDQDATEEEVEIALQALQNAITNLENEVKEEVIGKDKLKQEYNDAKKLDVSNKTKESVNRLNKVLAETKSVLDNANAKQEEIDAALKALQEAIKQLEEEDKNKVPTPPSQKDPSDDGDGNDDEEGDGSAGTTSKENSEEKESIIEIGNATAEQTKVEKGSKNTLPKTATPMFSMMFIGFMLMVLGFAYFIFQRTARRKQM